MNTAVSHEITNSQSITILPEHLVHQIAAGEVVERPASVVKELVENSIDANATSIIVEIRKGGSDLIKVTDNGHGMNRIDAQMSIRHHATSKITREEDLRTIVTMGFRGEALSSIAAVSQLELITKEPQSNEGAKIIVNGGGFTESLPCGCPAGTQIIIKNLFYNTPARRKFLKNENTEYQHIVGIVTEHALAHPGIGFKLVHNDRVIMDVPKTTVLNHRIEALLGKDVARELVPIFYGGNDLKITGFVGTTRLTRGNRNGQHVFVNNRPVEDNVIAHAVRSAYKVYLNSGQYPVFVVKIAIDPRKIDINVHPRKTEIRFEDKQEVYKAVMKASMAALDRSILAPDIFAKRTEPAIERRDEVPTTGGKQSHDRTSDGKTAIPPLPDKSAYRTMTVEDALNFTEQILKTDDRERSTINNSRATDGPRLTPLVQIGNKYILAEDEEGLVIIDQHAAHERVMHDKLRKALRERTVSSQRLLAPATFDLAPRDLAALEQHRDIFAALGFEIEQFGGNTCAVHAVPSGIAEENICETIMESLEDLRREADIAEVKKREEKLLATVACKSAIKFGRPLTGQEQEALIRQWEKVDEEKYACPHGRPVMLRLTYPELERKFGRK